MHLLNGELTQLLTPQTTVNTVDIRLEKVIDETQHQKVSTAAGKSFSFHRFTALIPILN